MGGLSRDNWISLVPLIFWWIWPLGSAAIFETFATSVYQNRRNRKKSDGKYERDGVRGFYMYNYLKTSFLAKPPAWIFFVVWVAIYLVIGISTWLFVNWATARRPIYDAQFSLLWVNFVFNVLWVPLFFTFRKPVLAWIDLVLVFVTAAAVCVIRFVDAADTVDRNTPEIWISAGLYTLYPLWVLYALILFTDILYTMRGTDYTKLGLKKTKQNSTR